MKVKMGVTIEQELYEKLLILAREDKRSLSAYVNYLLYKAIEE
ncbi:MAG: hypothetical protein Q4A65_01345 [Bacillota bacterium]|nr:hypothetical protein [Bacillota bacterium]